MEEGVKVGRRKGDPQQDNSKSVSQSGVERECDRGEIDDKVGGGGPGQRHL